MYTAGPVVQHGELVPLSGTAFSLTALNENRRRTLENTTHSVGFGKPAMESSEDSEFGGSWSVLLWEARQRAPFRPWSHWQNLPALSSRVATLNSAKGRNRRISTENSTGAMAPFFRTAPVPHASYQPETQFAFLCDRLIFVNL